MSLVFLLYALFASVFTVAKYTLEFTQPLFLVGSRMLVAGVILLAYQYIRYPDSFHIKKSAYKRIFLLALFNIYLTNAFEFWGLQYLSSFKTCFIYSLSPFLSALFSYFAFSEKMTPLKWLGMLIGFLGFVPILMAEGPAESSMSHLFGLSFAELAVVMACVCSMYGWIVLRQLVKEDGLSPLMANGAGMLLGGAMSLINSALVENWDPIPVTSYAPFLGGSLLLIIISNLCAYNLYGFLLRRFTATFLSFAGWTTPVFTALFGWIFLGEVITWHVVASVSIVCIGMILFYKEELRQGYVVRQQATQTT